MAIVVTGAAGFIPSALIRRLNDEGYTDIIAVDDFSRPDKQKNYSDKLFRQKIDRKIFLSWFEQSGNFVDFVFHLGARTDTTEFNYAVFEELNVSYSKKIWELCAKFDIPLVYASSAATYGGGELGYKDDDELALKLQPLNPYGISKNEFDKWAIHQEKKPPFWAGLKFFNVYGANEYHKGRMASVIFHSFNQIRSSGQVKLFRSHKEGIKDGEQLRDFIYVKDLVNVCLFLKEKHPISGLFNLGTGKARSFLSLAQSVFAALNIPENIIFTDMPLDIRDKYQYFTEADMTKLYKTGYHTSFTTLEEGVKDYVQNYLLEGKYL